MNRDPPSIHCIYSGYNCSPCKIGGCFVKEAIFLSKVFQYKLNNNNFYYTKDNDKLTLVVKANTAALTQHILSWTAYLL